VSASQANVIFLTSGAQPGEDNQIGGTVGGQQLEWLREMRDNVCLVFAPVVPLGLV